MMLDEEIGEAALIRVGCLLLLLAAEVDFGARGKTVFDNETADLGIEVTSSPNGRCITVGVGHAMTIASTIVDSRGERTFGPQHQNVPDSTLMHVTIRLTYKSVKQFSIG